MINQSRRKIIKGLGYGLALSVTGISTAALSVSQTLSSKQPLANALPSCDITIFQQQSSAKEIVSLMNPTDKPIILNSIKPVGLEHINGSLVVKLNNISNGTITLAAGEQLSFEIEATSTQKQNDNLHIPNVLAGHVKISSDHPAFNGIIPVTVFDNQSV